LDIDAELLWEEVAMDLHYDAMFLDIAIMGE
jgi:hypothetical protein